MGSNRDMATVLFITKFAICEFVASGVDCTSIPYFPVYTAHFRRAILGPKSQVRIMLRIWNACTSMKIEVRTPNEDWGCALYKGAHYTPKNTVMKVDMFSASCVGQLH